MMLCLLLVLKYYKGLKMLKRLTEEVVIPISYRAVCSQTKKKRKVKKNNEIKLIFLGAIPFSQREYVCWNGRI